MSDFSNPRRWWDDLRAATRAALRTPWFAGYALICVLAAGGLAVLRGEVGVWLGYYLGLVGLGSLGAAFLVYRGTQDPAAQAQAATGRGPIRHPAAETVLILAFIAAFVLVRVDQLLQGPFTTALLALAPGLVWAGQPLPILGMKLLLNVVLPLAAFRALGYSLLTELGLRWGAGRRLWPVFLLIGGPKLLGALPAAEGAGPGAGWAVVSLALSAVFYFFAAGLPEELMNRVLLQTRLEAWLGSPTRALFLQAAIFALIHIPIRLIGGGDLLAIAGNLLLFVMTLGLLFGFIYARTAALFPVAWLHALVNA